MNDLLVVFVGLALILYIFLTLASARTAIQKGLNGIGLTVLTLLVTVAVIVIYSLVNITPLIFGLIIIVPLLTFLYTIISQKKEIAANKEMVKNDINNAIL